MYAPWCCLPFARSFLDPNQQYRSIKHMGNQAISRAIFIQRRKKKKVGNLLVSTTHSTTHDLTIHDLTTHDLTTHVFGTDYSVFALEIHSELLVSLKLIPKVSSEVKPQVSYILPSILLIFSNICKSNTGPFQERSKIELCLCNYGPTYITSRARLLSCHLRHR